MKVGIIGTGWGRTHCGTFRAAGCEIAAFLGRDAQQVEQVASEEGVGIATTDPRDLEACDVIVIASPTSTHLEYLHRFRHKPILCEKPLSPAPLSDNDLRTFEDLQTLETATVFINYAFPFLDSIRALDRQIDEDRLGTVHRIILQVGVSFPAEKSPIGWFHDVAVHPLSWVLHRFGRFDLERFFVGRGPADVSTLFLNGSQQLDAMLYPLPRTGLRLDWTLIGSRGVACLGGGFQPGREWWFDPLLVDDEPVTRGEYSRGDSRDGRDGDRRLEDIWYRANRRAVAQFCAVLRGESTVEGALTRGSFDLRKAAEMERMLAPLLEADR